MRSSLHPGRPSGLGRGNPGRTVALVDDRIEQWWDRLRGRPLVDRVFYSASALGDFSLIWHLLGAARSLAPGHRPSEALRSSVTMGAESALVNGPVKFLFRRVRPAPPDAARPHRLRQPLTSSFPSGHATAAFTAAALLSEGARAPARAAVYALATIVATSRIHVRIHHPSDVAAGALMGMGMGWLARRAWTIVPAPLGTRRP